MSLWISLQEPGLSQHHKNRQFRAHKESNNCSFLSFPWKVSDNGWFLWTMCACVLISPYAMFNLGMFYVVHDKFSKSDEGERRGDFLSEKRVRMCITDPGISFL